MSLQTAMRKGYLILPPDFEGRELLMKRLLEFPLSDSDDLISALALLSSVVDRKGNLPGLEKPKPKDWSVTPWSSGSSRPAWPN